MSYAGTNRGGTSAILAAEKLLRDRASERPELSPAQLYATIPGIIDQVMGEGGLYSPTTGASAMLQAGGDTAEAVHLMRSHRSTLPRLAHSEPIDPDEMVINRRVIPAHRRPDGPQLLGATFDYTPRLITDDPAGDPLGLDPEELLAGQPVPDLSGYEDRPPQRFTEWLRERNLLSEVPDHDDPEPYDLTLHPISLPAERSALLSAMSIAETGALVNAWYRGVTGPDGHTDEHITLGDVRYGELEVSVAHPHTGRAVAVGMLAATDAEVVAHLDQRGEDTSKFDAGYGFAFGHNERKAIAMGAMNLAWTREGDTPEGVAMEQVLMHTTDGLAANGFLEHLKLPHYVTFRSQIERAEASARINAERERARRERAAGHAPGDTAAAPRDTTPAAAPLTTNPHPGSDREEN